MSTNNKQLLDKIVVIVLATFFIIIFSGVSSAEIGRILLSKKVEAAFEAYKFNPNYVYYYANLENNPCAVIGIRKDYNISGLLWSKVHPDSDEFNKVIELVKRFPMYSLPAFGGYILDSQGNTIGEYYSTSGAGVVVEREKKTLMLTIFMSGSPHHS